MRKIWFILALLLLAPASLAASGDVRVTWSDNLCNGFHLCYNISVQNMLGYERDINISTILSNTDFDISKVSNVVFYEWKNISHEVSHSESFCNPYDEVLANTTIHHTNCTTISYTTEKYYPDWKESMMQWFKRTSNEYRENMGMINIPKYDSKNKGDTFNGTKYFRIEFDTPPTKITTGWGSTGKMAMEIDGYEYHPWWNVSYAYRMNISCTSMTDGTPLIINGSGGFEIAGNQQLVWTYCYGDGTALYYNDETDYVVANDTMQLPFEVESGDGTSYSPTGVWDGHLMVQHLEESSGVATDSSEYGNDMSLRNTPTQNIPGKFGTAYNFSGGTSNPDHLNISDNPTLDTTAYTQILWHKGIETNNRCVLEKSVGRYFMLSDDGGCSGKWIVGWSNGGGEYVCADVEMNDDRWYMVVSRFENDNLSLFINGSLVTSLDPPSNAETNNDEMTLGGRTDVAPNSYQGIIDEFRFINATVSDAYISEIWNNAQGVAGYGDLAAQEETSGLVVTLSSPADSAEEEFEGITIVCNASSTTTLINASLWTNTTGTWARNQTTSLTGTTDSATFTLNYVRHGSYKWNCEVWDDDSDMEYAIANRTFSVIGYIIDSTDADNTTIEGERIRYNINMTVGWDVAGISGYLNRDGSSYVLTNITYGYSNYSIRNFTYTLATPLLPAGTDTSLVSFNFSFTLNYTDGSQATFMSSTYNQNVSQIKITACDTGALALNFTIYDEENMTAPIPNVTFSVFFTIQSDTLLKNYSYTMNGQSNYSFCIWPASSSLVMNATIQYSNSSYPIRNYYLEDATIDNATDSYSIFLLSDTYAKVVRFEILDASGLAVENALIKVMRYDYDTTAYRTMCIGKTDDDGKAIIRLRGNDIFYKLMIEQYGTLLADFNPSKIPIDPTDDEGSLTLTADPTELGAIYTYIGSVAYGCFFNETTRVLRCTLSDSTGDTQTINLDVWEVKPNGMTLMYEGSVSGSSSTLTYTVPEENTTYSYRFFATFLDGREFTLSSGSVMAIGGAVVWGAMGLMMTMFMFLTLSAVGIYKPEYALIMGGGAILMAAALNVLAIEITSGGIAGLLVVIAVLIYRMRDK